MSAAELPCDDILDTPPEPNGTHVPERIEGSLAFERVSFRYGMNEPLLLDDVSFRVEAGERLAIAGASGTGKSTILKLAMGLLRPVSGRVLLDGRELREYDLEALRPSIGMVHDRTVISIVPDAPLETSPARLVTQEPPAAIGLGEVG